MTDERKPDPATSSSIPTGSPVANAATTSHDPDDDNAPDLSIRQDEAIIALMREPTIAKAAQSMGVHERTIRRWLKQRDFQRRYREARRESYDQAIAVMQKHSSLAAHTLVRTMMSDKTPDSVKISAAREILNQSRGGMELGDLAARIDELEASMDESQKSKRKQ